MFAIFDQLISSLFPAEWQIVSVVPWIFMPKLSCMDAIDKNTKKKKKKEEVT